MYPLICPIDTRLRCPPPPDCHQKVWVVCTNEVFPSDLAPFLWHHYGTTVQPGDLDGYRAATRRLLGEYTEHYTSDSESRTKR